MMLVPIHWKKKKISEFTSVITGGTPSTSVEEYWSNGTVPWLRSGELKDNIITESRDFITKNGLEDSSAKLMPKNTVLIALTGVTTGKTALLNFEASANQSVTGILPSEQHIPKFLFYYLQFIRNEILHKSYGDAQPHISQDFVKKLEIPLPELKEQRLIVSEIEKQFSRLDEVTKSLKSLKTKLETYKKSVLKAAFENEDFPKNPLSEIVASIKSGYACGKHTKDDRNLLHFRPYNIDASGNIDMTLGKFVDPDFSSKRLEKGDIVFNNTNSSELVGKTCYYGEKEAVGFSNHMTRIKVNQSKANAKFIAKYLHFLFLKGYYKKIMKSHVNQSSVNIDQLQKIEVPLPPLNIQKVILENLEKSDSGIDRIQKSIELILERTEQLRKSILKTAFEGKLVK